jgi:hypothetical protein
MAKLSTYAGAPSLTVNLFIQDSRSSTGAGLTGLTWNTSGLIAYYVPPLFASISITLATQTVTGAYSTGGFVEIDSVHMPGWYRFDMPNFILGGAKIVSFMFSGAANMAPCPFEIESTQWNNQDGTRGGLLALPNVNIGGSGGFPLIDGTGRVTLAAVTHTGARVPNVTLTDTVTIYTGNTVQTGDNFARTGAPVGASISADVAAVKGDSAAIKVQTDKLAFTVANQVDSNVIDWKSTVAPAMTGDAFARIGVNGAGLTAVPMSDTSGTTTLLTRIPGTVQPQTGDSFGRLGIAGVGLTNLGDTRIANLDATISSRSTFAGGAVSSVTGAVGSVGSPVTVGTNSDKTGYSLAITPPTAIQVRTEMDTNSTKLANLDATISSRLAPAGTLTTVTNLTNAPIVGDFTSTMKTSLNTSTPSGIPTTAAIADKILGRNIAGGSDGGRTMTDALRFLRNKVVISGTTIQIFAEDDTTVAWSGVLATDPSAIPIVSIDPV